MVDAITRIMYQATKGCIEKKKRFRKSVHWWTEALTKMKKDVNRLTREYQRETNIQIKTEMKRKYTVVRRKYTKES